MVTICTNTSSTNISGNEGSLRIPFLLANLNGNPKQSHSQKTCNFSLTSLSQSDRLFLVLPNITSSPNSVSCPQWAILDQVEFHIKDGLSTNDGSDEAPTWMVCTSDSRSDGARTDLTKNASSSRLTSRTFVTSGPVLDVFIDFASDVDNNIPYSLEGSQSGDSIRVYFKSFTDIKQLKYGGYRCRFVFNFSKGQNYFLINSRQLARLHVACKICNLHDYIKQYHFSNSRACYYE